MYAGRPATSSIYNRDADKTLDLQELARQLNSDVLPKFQDKGVKMFLISIGPPERGIKFNDLTGLPQEHILADPDNLTYDALGFKNDTFSAFFSWEVRPAVHHHTLHVHPTSETGRLTPSGSGCYV